MPLILQKNIENGKIGLWKITETLCELEQLSRLSPQDEVTYSGIAAQHRKKEWLGTRLLVNELTRQPLQINYSDEGCPTLDKVKYKISISHTTGFVAVMLHDFFNPGIDIE